MPIIYQRLTERTLATGATKDDLIHIVIPSDISQDPDGSSYKITLEQLQPVFSANTFTGGSSNCITDLYTSNIHSCSPLNINPLDEGNVYFGSTSGVTIDVTNSRLGIGTENPQYPLDVVNTDSRLYYDPTSVGGRFAISGVTNVPRFNVEVPPYLTKLRATLSLGMRAWDDLLYPDYGNPGDAHIYAGVNAYGLNIISEYGATSEDYIRFYAGQDAYGTVPDIHIQGSGGTRGNVGIATASPKEKLHVSGNTLITGYLGLNNNNNPQYVLDAIGTQSRMYYDSESFGGRILLSGNTNVPRIGVAISSYLTKPTTGFELGMRTWNDATYPGYGKVGDAFFYAGVETNGFNVLNPTGTGTEDYIRFYAGQLANGNTPDMHIQGSGTTRGYIGIGTSVPTQKLHVSGNTIISSGLTASTLNVSSTPTTDTGTTVNYLTRDGSTGEVKVKTIPGSTVYGLFSQTGNSVAVSATTVETTLISGGVGSIIIPANGFSVGDGFHGVLIGHISCVGTATLHIRIKTVSGVLLAETGVMAMEAATNKHWKLDVNFTVRQVGAATVASIASGGLFSYTKNSGLNFEGVNFSLVENTTFDTTISNTLVVTAQWNTNNAGNSIYSEIFTLNKIY